MKAPVGLLSDRTVLRQQDGGASPRQVPVCRADRQPKTTQKTREQHGTLFYGNRQQPVSGTAHCRRAGDAALRPDAGIKAGDTAPVQTGRDVVLVTPTYAWRIPRVVSEWLGKTALTGAERIWFVMDCGSEIGNAAKYNRQLAAQKHLHYMGTAQVVMPENYIAMFHAPQKEQAKSIVEQAEPVLQKVLAQLRAGQEFPPPRETLYDRLMSGPVNPVFYRFFVKADAFRATDACIGCGKCVELCPLNNIRLENGKPVWGKNCTHCMACICYCPKEAIEYGEKSKGKPRYHFEALEKKQDV